MPICDGAGVPVCDGAAVPICDALKLVCGTFAGAAANESPHAVQKAALSGICAWHRGQEIIMRGRSIRRRALGE